MKYAEYQFSNTETARFGSEGDGKPAITCTNCGKMNPPASKYCNECGRGLGQPAQSLSIDSSQPRSFTPKFLADKILSTCKALEGERKVITVLFADVANYTSISERLDAEDIHQIMDGCFKIVMDAIYKYEGTIDKFTGDGVMALFGAPLALEDHAKCACYASLEIQRALEGYGEKIMKECGVEFKMRVGLNSGPVIVGSIGNDLRMDYTAIGDTTNLASRMENMARPGGILVSAETHRMASDFFKFEAMGKVQVKGKEEAVEAYELIESSEVETRIEAAVARGLTKFVGRQREMDVLKDAFQKAQSGSGQVVGIVGEAGVGKSRLILELMGTISEEEYTYLEGWCLHYGNSIAYLSLLDIIRLYFDIKDGDEEVIIKKKMKERIAELGAEFTAYLPPLHEILSLKVEDEAYFKLEPTRKREKQFEAIKDLLIQASQIKPLVLVVEDLHWVDKTTEEFLSYLIGWLANARILLILLYRPEYSHSWGINTCYSQIGVDQLSTKTSAELVQSILKSGEVASELTELILSRAAGNPLFVEEFTHTLLENGSIQWKDDEHVLSTKAADIQVPDTIQGIIAARMDRLEENLKQTLQVASVIGRDFAFRILQAITGMGEELKSYLLDLQGLEFIYEKRSLPEQEYIFKHALTQEVAYHSLLLRRRREIHEKAGEAIEELYQERLEEFYGMLAYHYSQSENSEKAYQYLKLAGGKASLTYSSWEALRFYKEAIDILNKEPGTEENKRRGIELRLLMESPMRLLGYPEKSLQILQEGERLAREVGDERGLTSFYSSIGLYYSMRGDPLLGRKYMEDCLGEAQKIQDIELMAPIGFDLCTSYNTTGKFSKLVEVTPNILALFERTKEESGYEGNESYNLNAYLSLSSYYGLGMAWLGNFKEGEAICGKLLHLGQDMNSRYGVGLAELSYGGLFCIKGDGEKAVKHLLDAKGHCEEGQLVLLLGLVWMRLGWAHYFLGDLETAQKHIEKGLQIQNEAGLSTLLSQYRCCLSMVLLDSGQLENAKSCIEKALKLARDNNEKHVEGTSMLLQGRIKWRADSSRYDEAEERILRGITILDELKIKPFVARGHLYLAELYTDTGQTEKAKEHLRKAYGLFRDMGMDYWFTRTQRVLETLRRLQEQPDFQAENGVARVNTQSGDRPII